MSLGVKDVEEHSSLRNMEASMAIEEDGTKKVLIITRVMGAGLNGPCMTGSLLWESS